RCSSGGLLIFFVFVRDGLDLCFGDRRFIGRFLGEGCGWGVPEDKPVDDPVRSVRIDAIEILGTEPGYLLLLEIFSLDRAGELSEGCADLAWCSFRVITVEPASGGVVDAIRRVEHHRAIEQRKLVDDR